MSDEGKKVLRCSFCGKREQQVHRMIQGPGVRICDECVQLCMSILDEGFDGPESEPLEDIPDQLPTPKEIRAVLDNTLLGRTPPKWRCPWRYTTIISGSISAAATMWNSRRATS